MPQPSCLWLIRFMDGLGSGRSGATGYYKGMLLWLAGDTPENLRGSSRRGRCSATRGTENTVAVQLLIGLGTLRMHRGEYKALKRITSSAVEMAGRLGNDTESQPLLAT